MTNIFPSPIDTAARRSLSALMDAEKNISGSEEGNALNALGFIEQALDNIKAGDYVGFLAAAELAGAFARDARPDMYERLAAEARARSMAAAVQRINENTEAQYVRRDIFSQTRVR